MMSLWTGLAILGGLLLAGVIAHSAWQIRRNALQVAQADAPKQPDGLTAGHEHLIEPSLHGHTGLQGAADLDAHSDLFNLSGVGGVAKAPALDALIDALAAITVDAPIAGEAVVAALPPTRRVGGKAFAIEGLNLAGQWEAPRGGERYSAFQAGVQLASRTGALNDIEFSEFVQKVQSFADAIGAVAQFPEMRDEVGKARELDQFASAHDAQLAFTLRAKSVAWSKGYILQNAARLGFMAGSFAGRMVLPASAAGQAPILALHFDPRADLADESEHAAVRQIDLTLDAPHVARSEQPYLRLREMAHSLAAAMDGFITDQQGLPISRDAMDAIGADLEQLYDALEARDMAAGSALARRLFS